MKSLYYDIATVKEKEACCCTSLDIGSAQNGTPGYSNPDKVDTRQLIHLLNENNMVSLLKKNPVLVTFLEMQVKPFEIRLEN